MEDKIKMKRKMCNLGGLTNSKNHWLLNFKVNRLEDEIVYLVLDRLIEGPKYNEIQ